MSVPLFFPLRLLHLLLLWSVILGSVGQAEEQPVTPGKLEPLLLLPEPRAMRTELSLVPRDSQQTVFSAARETTEVPGVVVYSNEEFRRLGLSLETFAARAKKAADRLLAGVKPDLVKGASGEILYAVYRGPRPIMASLLVAPTLPAVAESLLGGPAWAILPDRHSLYLFRAEPAAVAAFAQDLAERFKSDPHAASVEVFALQPGQEPRVVGSVGD